MIKKGLDIDEASRCIQQGELVAFPTETVYGLGADALNPMAVAKIFEAKERPTFDPLIVHISDISQLEELFEIPINNIVYTLAEKFWPGPLTIVHRKNRTVPDLVTADLETVAVRMPGHPIALEFIKKTGCPIAAPSANKFGQLSPTRAAHVIKQQMKISYILENDAGILGLESTVVLVEQDACYILRPGIITLEQLKEVVPTASYNVKSATLNLPSPGLLKSHYSPNKRLAFLEKTDQDFSNKTGLILHSRSATPIKCGKIIYTSQTFNLIEVAANIFSSLHQMEDDASIEEIFIERVEECGLGIAIMDRLKKACYKYQ